jgi:GT2 family glycosyltransferase
VSNFDHLTQSSSTPVDEQNQEISNSIYTPVLSIVVVNSDSEEYTLKCLESIFRCPPDESYEVIVVDNCSDISCLPLIQERYPRVRTFSAPRRQGFSRNYNLGIRLSRGMYVLVLNNDTIVPEGALNTLLAAVRENPSYDMVGPRILSPGEQIQTTCARSFPTPRSYILTQLLTDRSYPVGRLWDRYLQWKLERRAGGPVPCISGACMLIKREAVESVGLLDEEYDFYYEDVEWCHRLQRHNKIVAYIPEARILHFGDQSLSHVKVWAKKSEYQSAIRYFGQYHHLTVHKKWLLWIVTAPSYFMRAFAFLLIEAISSKRSHARAYRRLCRWIINQRPDRLTDNND